MRIGASPAESWMNQDKSLVVLPIVNKQRQKRLGFQNTLAKTRKLDSFLIRQSESTSHDTEESSEKHLIDSTDNFLPSTTPYHNDDINKQAVLQEDGEDPVICKPGSCTG